MTLTKSALFNFPINFFSLSPIRVSVAKRIETIVDSCRVTGMIMEKIT